MRADPKPLPQNSVIYASDGTPLVTLHAEEDRVVVPLSRIPKHMREAAVAIEDRRFWSHRGIDLKALLRAAYVNASEGRVVEGGSTITQQYVKNAIVGSDRTLKRKIREAALAWKLEDRITKKEILERYLNTIYFGKGAYGVQAAARKYFSKSAPLLTLPESAMLAGLIAGPERWDPTENPEGALARRNLVLSAMLRERRITRQQHAEASASPLGLNPAIETKRYPAAYFVEHVKEQILTDERFGKTQQERYDALFRGGLRIYTTIDLKTQKQAESSVKQVLSQKGDPHGAMTVIDPRNGFIRAMVGGRNFFARNNPVAQVNLATGDGGTGRQAGSSFKPFALVAALENGISPQKRYRGGTSISIPQRYGPPWVVRNYEGSSYGSLTLEQATINSVNVVYAQLIKELGPKRVVVIAHQMGIRSKLRALPSAVLGANEVNTLEMASAYGTLATNGMHVEPTSIERVTTASGREIFRAASKPEEVLNPSVAWVTTQILRKVIIDGPGVAANIGRPAAGKTGTAQQWRDAWFAGYIPQLTAAVWVGFPKRQASMVPPRTRTRVTGGSFPAQIWNAFMTKATKGMPVEQFEKPRSTYVTVVVDVTRGCVLPEGMWADNVKTVTFVAGTQPKKCRADDGVALLPGSTGPQSGVPSVVGMPLPKATALLAKRGFSTSSTAEYHPYYADGTVIRQMPAAGSSAEPGSVVALVVATKAKPYSVVPKVTGLTEAQAKTKLESAGFAVAIHTASSYKTGKPAGVVLQQSPKPGIEKPVGSTVTIVVNPAASSPPPSPSPT